MTDLETALSDLGLAEIRYLERVSSTNEVAMMWLNQGAPDLALVVANEQSAGRGRFDRRWVTRPGVALAFSLILRPTPQEAARFGFFAPLGALGLADALDGLYALAPQIKWPNDVLLGGRKVAGILVESAWEGDQPCGVVIGIGVNVRPEAVPPAADVAFPATSVEDALGQPVDRWQLLRVALAGILTWRPRIGNPEFFAAWQERLAFRGEIVRVTSGYESQPEREGRLLGIDPDGSLRLAGTDGREITVEVGDIHLRPAS